MNAKDAIAHALDDLVKNSKQFTNYDVTKHARSFTDENVKHNDVIAYVAVEMDTQAGYYLDTVSVTKDDGSYSNAALFSPNSKYAYQYSQHDIQTNKSLKGSVCCGGSIAGCSGTSPAATAMAAASSAASTVSKFQSGSTAVASAPSSSGVKREVIVDNRGRVCIPKSFLDRIGKKAGDVVYVQKSSVKGLVLISAIRWSPSACTYLTSNQVDCYGNVRITPKTINKCNVSKTSKGGSDYVTIRSEKDHIVIE